MIYMRDMHECEPFVPTYADMYKATNTGKFEMGGNDDSSACLADRVTDL
jgi:hypothetical protein